MTNHPALIEGRTFWRGSSGIDLTLRDWFAGQALAGYLAGNAAVSAPEAAIIAYGIADAMLNQRQEPVMTKDPGVVATEAPKAGEK